VTAALVDVDGTLIRGPSSERLFLSYMLREHRLRARQVAAGVAFYVLWWRRYGKHVAKKNKGYLAGLEVSEVEEAASLFVHRDLLGRLRPSVMDRIARHRKAGHPVALLTGTPDFIARPLAAEIGVTTFRATQCAQQDGTFVGCPPLTHPFGEEKLRAAQALCAELGVALGSCVAYANSYFDLPLLARVAEPVAVAPDRRLRREAVRRGWAVLER
jgi:HAD superfamily hydrolase (TIGR01490 family)